VSWARHYRQALPRAIALREVRFVLAYPSIDLPNSCAIRNAS